MLGDIKATAEFALRVHDELHDHLPIWAVFDTTTKDYPGLWVARLSLSVPQVYITNLVIVRATLPELRDALPPGVTRLERSPQDVPEMIESWI